MSPHANNNKRDLIINNNGLYPPPLKIHKDSHFIKKSSSSSSSSPSSSSSSSPTSSLANAMTGGSVIVAAMTGGSVIVAGAAKPPQQHRHPVIIYTHSPKIIHTHPRDFMALVQKLTGLSRFDDEAHVPPPQPTAQPMKPEAGEHLLENELMMNNKINGKVVMRNEDTDSSSAITTEENCGSRTNIMHSNINSNVNNNNVGNGNVGGDGQVSSCFVPPNPYFGNIPAYAPNAADFLCSNPINHIFTTI